MNSLPFIRLRNKIKFETTPTEWHHQRGGWSYVLQQLQQQLYAPDGTLCISAVEECVCNGEVISEPWVGFVHQVPCSNYVYYPDLQKLVKNDTFLASLENCRGLFVLTETIKNYLKVHLPFVIPIANVPYPITPFNDDLKFSWEKFDLEPEKRVLFIGEFMRNFQSFYDLKVPNGYKKMLLHSPDVNFDNLYDCDKKPITLHTNSSVTVLSRVEDSEYDKLLSSSLVFLNLFDAGANTTTLECLGRGTPLVINRLPAIEEYLGTDYPLYYDSLEEATELLGSKEKLLQGSEYLTAHMNKNPLTGELFTKSFASSAIYRCLPLPKSQRASPTQTKFPHFDLTVVICSYKRVHNIPNILRRFEAQTFQGSFELVLWNNNKETQTEIEQICAKFKESMNIRLIQSSENYYCIIRLAVAQLMQSDLLLICDDDTLPEPNYISKFIAKYEQYGPKAVLCCRGHIFKPHALSEESPHTFWENYQHLKFFDEDKPDQQVSQIFLTGCICSSILSRYDYDHHHSYCSLLISLN